MKCLLVLAWLIALVACLRFWLWCAVAAPLTTAFVALAVALATAVVLKTLDA